MFGKRFFIFLGVCLLASTGLCADEFGVVDCHTHPDPIQVSAVAAKTPNTVASLPCGEHFTLLVYGEVFSRIRTVDGKIGYIYSYLVSQPDAETSHNPLLQRVHSLKRQATRLSKHRPSSHKFRTPKIKHPRKPICCEPRLLYRVRLRCSTARRSGSSSTELSPPPTRIQTIKSTLKS